MSQDTVTPEAAPQDEGKWVECFTPEQLEAVNWIAMASNGPMVNTLFFDPEHGQRIPVKRYTLSNEMELVNGSALNPNAPEIELEVVLAFHTKKDEFRTTVVKKKLHHVFFCTMPSAFKFKKTYDDEFNALWSVVNKWGNLYLSPSEVRERMEQLAKMEKVREGITGAPADEEASAAVAP